VQGRHARGSSWGCEDGRPHCRQKLLDHHHEQPCWQCHRDDARPRVTGPSYGTTMHHVVDTLSAMDCYFTSLTKLWHFSCTPRSI
jgi:hypothetical protein